MGSCRSCDTTAVAVPSTKTSASITAKLILRDGRLQEFDSPVPVSNVLHKELGCFVCNADDMEFGRHVSALSAYDVFSWGSSTLFSLVPCSVRNASAALVKCCCHNGSVAPLGFTDRTTLLQGGRPEPRRMKRQQRAGSSGSGSSFTPTLNAISEIKLST